MVHGVTETWKWLSGSTTFPALCFKHTDLLSFLQTCLRDSHHRAFAHAGSSDWNALPEASSLTSFCLHSKNQWDLLAFLSKISTITTPMFHSHPTALMSFLCLNTCDHWAGYLFYIFFVFIIFSLTKNETPWKQRFYKKVCSVPQLQVQPHSWFSIGIS